MSKSVFRLSISGLLKYRPIPLILLLLFLSGTVSGKSKEYTDKLSGSSIQTSSWQFVLENRPEYHHSTKRIRHIFMLHIPTPTGVDVSATVDLNITYSRLGTDISETATPRLILDYTVGNDSKSQDRAIFLLDDALITSFQSSFTGTIPAEVELTYIAQVEWVETFTRDLVPEDLHILHNPVTGNYEVSWGVIPEAEEYHLEWVHVNNYSEHPGGKIALDYDFDRNATRISTQENRYTLSPVFDNGYLFCRVRAVGYSDLEKTYPITSRWSCSPNACSGKFTGQFFAVETFAHTEDKLNWQYITNYAESGKRKEVITYYDGTMRSHQAVTRLNTDSITIVGETYYDHQGRAAIQSLPVPSGRTRLEFHPNFNVSAGEGRQDSVYGRRDFDLNSRVDLAPNDPSCKITVNAMSSDSGSARYYSDQNPDKETGLNRFIPDAGGFPFTQTEYEPDNTGRIRRQGGVGPDYQFGARPSRETKYFYGKPSQEELNRLFGSEVGYSSHYQKNVVQDANGQLSVTYLDMQGRTIATALSGNPAHGLQALPSNEADKQQRTTVSIIDNQPISSFGSNYLSTYHHLVTTRGDHKFEYSLPAIKVIDEEGLLPPNTCLDSLFVLTIDIRDECGERPVLEELSFPDEVPITALPITHTIGSVGNSCDLESDLSFKFTAKDLTVGKYVISRELTLNRKRYEKMDIDYLLTRKLDTVIRRKISEIDFSKCFTPKTCFEHCLSSDNMDSCLMACSYTDECEQVEVMMEADYFPGRTINSSDTFQVDLNGGGRQVMGGQYALYELGSDNRYTYSSDASSLFYPENFEQLKSDFSRFFVDGEGVPLHPDSMSVHNFIVNFREEYAQTLALAYHPERGCLETCRSEESRKSSWYEHQMQSTETYEEAYLRGLLNPLNISGNYPPNGLPNNLSNIDPFFDGLPKRNFFKFRLIPSFPHLSVEVQQLQNEKTEEMISYLTDRKIFTGANNATFTGNIWEQAVCAAIKSNTPSVSDESIESRVSGFNFTEFNSSTPDPCIRDRAWEFFRALYLAKRNKIEADLGDECEPDIPAGKIRRFVNKTDMYTAADKEIINAEELTESDMESKSQSMAQQVAEECRKQALAQAENCLERLVGCIRIGNELATDAQWNSENDTYNALKTAFTDIMTLSCTASDGAKMFGSTSLPEGMQTSGGYTSFVDAMEKILGSGQFSLECNPYLITFPMEESYEYNSYANYKKIDTCACDQLLKTNAEFYRLQGAGALPQGITSARRFFEKETGMAVDNYQAKICLCQNAYGGEVWLPTRPWSEEGKQELEASSEYIPVNLSCDVCIDCKMIQDWIDVFDNTNWILRLLSNGIPERFEPYRKQMLTNFLNNKLNLNKNYWDYEDFLNKCNASDTHPYCELSEQAKKLEGILNDVVGKGPVTGNQCDISESVGELQKSMGIDHSTNNCHCNSYTYQPSVNGQVLTMNAVGQGCNNVDCPVTLEFVNLSAGYVFNGIVPFFGNIRPAPAPANALPGRYYFYIDANIVHNGFVVRDSMIGSTCFPIEICYRSGEKTITLCDREAMEGEDCEKELIHHATLVAQEVYKEYRDSVIHSFEDLFVARCMAGAGEESMTMNYGDNEHHYTLYYYDQAGNLVRTIPPQGVELVDQSFWSQINRDRLNGEQSVFTRHRMETRYLYNSLNQLVAQYMPDHEKMEAFSTGSTGSGLPAGMKVVSTEFLDGYRGVLFGENPQNPDQSLIYTTVDGGSSWQKASIAGLNRLNDISIVNSNEACIVGNGGTLLKTVDGGDSWTAAGSGTSEDLISVYMTDINNGHFFSPGGIWKYTGGTPHKYPDVPQAGETLTCAWFKNPLTGYAVGYDNNGGIIYYTANGGTSWEKLSPEILASKITYVQLLAGGGGYALDSNGMLLRTNNSGETWFLVHTHSNEQLDFRKIQFLNNTEGWAITEDLRLLYTDNSATSWQQTSNQIKDFWADGAHFYLLTGTGDIVNMGGLTGTEGTIADAEHIYVDGNAACYAWSDDAVYRKEGVAWVPYATGLTGKIRKLSSVLYQDQTIVMGLTEENEVFRPFSGEVCILPEDFTPVDMTVEGNRVYLLSSAGKITFSSDGGANWSEPGIGISSGTASSLDIDETNRVLVGGDDGRIYYATVNGINTYRGTIKQPEQLQSVHAGNSITVSVGNNGTVLWNAGTDETKWHLRKLQTNEKLYAVQTTTGNGALIAGQGGMVFECVDLNNQPFEIRESIDGYSTVHTIAASGSTLLTGTDSGRLGKIQGIQSTSQMSEGGINAVRIFGNKAFAVGNGGVIYRLTPLSSAFWTRQEGDDVYSYTITSSAKAGGKLFAVTADGNILSSVDNGASWHPSSVSGVNGLKSIHFYAKDPDYGIAVGANVILTTEDGGDTWVKSAYSTSAPNSVYMTGAGIASIVESSGRIWQYNNGNLSEQYVKNADNETVPVSVSLNSVGFDPDNRVGVIAGDGGTLLKTTDGQTWERLLSPEPNPVNWAAYTDVLYGRSTDLNAIHVYDRAVIYAAGNNGVLLKSTDGGASWERKPSGTGSNLQDIAFKDRETAILGGTGSTAMLLTDKRERFSSYFYYDRLGRIVASQNSKQRSMTPPHYSYTRYDGLGRVVETGELASTYVPDEELINNKHYPDNWSMNRYQVSRNQYDERLSGNIENLFTAGQQNLRNRVASALYQEIYSKDSTVYDYATHYSYDIHGSVKELIQENSDLRNFPDQQYKKLVYEYDLVSGNVNKVSYQPGQPDQFYHKYEYDSDNRIINVYTSLNGLIWDNDASYQYYKHGPLARIELGDLKVQGIDYAYTLQGWIKSVNGFNDMGDDGNDNGFAKDAFAYSLHYNANDYKAISSATAFLDKVSRGEFANAGTDLYNGNISKMATAISGMPLLGKSYQYDELNRLVASNTFEEVENNLTITSKYNTAYIYDANGNIKNLTRNDDEGLSMDALVYHYAKDGNDNILNNRLLHVWDDVQDNDDLTVDLKDQGRNYVQNNPITHNYAYDKIGNLISDQQEEIANIEWNVGGKVTAIKRKAGSQKYDLRFQYDALGNRISKTVIYPTAIAGVRELTTYYVRDAQKNVMAVYEKRSYEDGEEEFALLEQHLYGTSRLGIKQSNFLLAKTDENIDIDLANSERILGEKHYELTSYLGNVFAVISDKRLLDNQPHIIAAYDYFPFGSLLPNRSTYDPANDYRFGFHGMEKEDELNGYTTEFRQYDPRLGRWLSVDPRINEMPWLGSYTAFDNKPIIRNDPQGDCPTCGAAAAGAVVGALMDMIIQVGEHMYNGDDIKTAISKIDYGSVVKEAGIGGLAGLSGFGAARYMKKAMQVVNSPAGRAVAVFLAEQAVDFAVSELAEWGIEASGLEAAMYGTLGFNKLDNTQISQAGRDATKSYLDGMYGDNVEILEEVYGSFGEGKGGTRFDFVVYDRKTDKILEVVESKASTQGNFVLSDQQKKYYEQGMEVELKGKNAGDLSGKKISTSTTTSTVRKTDVHKYTGRTSPHKPSSPAKKALKNIK